MVGAAACLGVSMVCSAISELVPATVSNAPGIALVRLLKVLEIASTMEGASCKAVGPWFTGSGRVQVLASVDSLAVLGTRARTLEGHLATVLAGPEIAQMAA